MDALKGLAASFTLQEKEEAEELYAKIYKLTQIIVDEKKSIDSNFVTLCSYVNKVRQRKYWLLGNYKTFGDFLESIEKEFNLGKSQLYVGMSVTRNLLPSMDESELVDIGITKAKVLSKYVEQSGERAVPQDILDMAHDNSKTVEELDAEVNARLHNVPPEKGTWRSLGGGFFLDDEWKEIEDAVELAKSVDPVISNSIPHWQQLKEVHLRWAREFMAAWSGG